MLRLGDGLARDVGAVLVHADEAALHHALKRLLGLHASLLLLLELGVLLNDAFQGLELVLDGLRLGDGGELLLLDLLLGPSALGPRFHQVGTGPSGFYRKRQG